MKRASSVGIVLTAALWASSSAASTVGALEKVKTGILPAGGLYSLYSVTCDEVRESRVARLRDSREWCVDSQGELDCFKRADEASRAACAVVELASATGEVETR